MHINYCGDFMRSVKFKASATFITFVFMAVLLIFSDICKTGIKRGIIICGNVIIPSLFPFMVCVLFLINMNITVKSNFVSKMLYNIFGHSFEMFCVMLFSMIGGYPVGCKMINEMFKVNKIDKKTAHIMQLYCVNAGPAFIVSAVGCDILNSKTVGIILFLSHISYSLLAAIFASKFMRKSFNTNEIGFTKAKSYSEIFVNSVSEASASIISICSYVILFSCFNICVDRIFKNINAVKYINGLIEVTSGVFYTKNIVFISFLLGFSGISIWCQIFSLSKNVKVDLKLFVLGRILHGCTSCIITYIILKVFNISVTVFSNFRSVDKKIFYNNAALSISLAIMIIVLMIYIYTKNCSGKLVKDMI